MQLDVLLLRNGRQICVRQILNCELNERRDLRRFEKTVDGGVVINDQNLKGKDRVCLRLLQSIWLHGTPPLEEPQNADFISDFELNINLHNFIHFSICNIILRLCIGSNPKFIFARGSEMSSTSPVWSDPICDTEGKDDRVSFIKQITILWMRYCEINFLLHLHPCHNFPIPFTFCSTHATSPHLSNFHIPLFCSSRYFLYFANINPSWLNTLFCDHGGHFIDNSGRFNSPFIRQGGNYFNFNFNLFHPLDSNVYRIQPSFLIVRFLYFYLASIIH
jgi:hypothetical protein